MQRQISGKFIAHNDDNASWAFDPPAPRQVSHGLSGSLAALARFGVLAASDVLAFGTALAATLAAFRLFSPASTTNSVHADLAGAASVALACVLLTLAEVRYRQHPAFMREMQQILAGSAAGLCLTGFFGFWSGHMLPHAPLLSIWLAFPALAMLYRAACRQLLDRVGLWRRRIIVVGSGPMLTRGLAALRSDPRHGFEIVEVMAPAMLEHSLTTTSASELLSRIGGDKFVMVADHDGWSQRKLTQALMQARVPFAVMPQLDGRPVLGCDRTSFFSHDMVMLSYRNNLARPVPRLFKAVFDVVVAALTLLFISPIFLLIALAVKQDGGPVFFSQRRIGANGRSFACLKFRSMVPHADTVLMHVLERDASAAVEWRETQKLRRDPRITPVGRLLRATSLDELPQLLNILRLEMSLVGPRPIIAAEAARYADNIAFYHEARPGLTGLWQVSGRSDTSYEQRVQLDCWYVKNWNIWHDLAIIFKTVPAVLKRSGAV